MTGQSFFPLVQGGYYCEPLSKEHRKVIKTFRPSHPNGKNIAAYLRNKALEDSETGIAKNFLVFEDPGYLCGFFTLKAGLFPLEARGHLFYTLSGIDLVYFTKNGAFTSEGNDDPEKVSSSLNPT